MKAGQLVKDESVEKARAAPQQDELHVTMLDLQDRAAQHQAQIKVLEKGAE